MRFAKPTNMPSQTARKALELGPPCTPRVRAEGEATSIVICAASAPRGYVTGDGDARRISTRYA